MCRLIPIVTVVLASLTSHLVNGQEKVRVMGRPTADVAVAQPKRRSDRSRTFEK